jgi:glycosyltransferase involved in cell wall biosynthesis
LVLNKFLIRQLDYVVSVSHQSANDYIRIFKSGSLKNQIIPTGFEKKEILNFPQDLKYLKDKIPLLLHVGGFTFEKNHTGLISIFEKFKFKCPSAQLLLVGSGKLESEIRQLVECKKLSDSVHFLGYRTDVLKIMKGVDVFVLPSIIEGLPGVILEAMYCKIPVVAYNVGGVSEVVKPNQTGWLVEKNDESGFISAIKETLNGNKTEQIIDNAYKIVCSEYMNEQISRKFEELYLTIIRKTY